MDHKGYWVIRCQELVDEAAMQKYGAAWPEIAEKYNARFIAGTSRMLVTEGPAVGRIIVVEFPSYQAALDCYHSPEYQQAKEYAHQAMERTFAILEGVVPDGV